MRCVMLGLRSRLPSPLSLHVTKSCPRQGGMLRPDADMMTRRPAEPVGSYSITVPAPLPKVSTSSATIDYWYGTYDRYGLVDTGDLLSQLQGSSALHNYTWGYPLYPSTCRYLLPEAMD